MLNYRHEAAALLMKTGLNVSDGDKPVTLTTDELIEIVALAILPARDFSC